MKKNRLLVLLIVLIFPVVMFGCSSKYPDANPYLSSSKTEIISNGWETQEQAETKWARVEIGMSIRDLEEKFNISSKNPNMRNLNWFDARQELVPDELTSGVRISPGIVQFIEAGDLRGTAFLISIRSEYSYGKGSFWSNFFRFKKNEETGGFTFRAWVLEVDNVVVYVSKPTFGPIGGSRIKKNPLGLLNETGNWISETVRGAL